MIWKYGISFCSDIEFAKIKCRGCEFGYIHVDFEGFNLTQSLRYSQLEYIGCRGGFLFTSNMYMYNVRLGVDTLNETWNIRSWAIRTASLEFDDASVGSC